jgi:tetratricopeptide (TPR) repeat protein
LKFPLIALASSLAFLFTSASGLAQAAPPSTTAAEDPAMARARLSEEGAVLYQAHDYRAAIEKYIEAYAKDPDPNLLYNQARCYDMLGDAATAQRKYKEFLSKAGGDLGARNKAEAALAKLAKETSTTKAPAGTTSGAAQGSEAPAAGSATKDLTTSKSSSTLPIALVVAGGCVAIGGAVFYGLGASDHSQLSSAPGYGQAASGAVVSSLTQADANAKINSGNTKKLIGGLGLGIGLASVVTGLIVWTVSGGSNAGKIEPGAPGKHARTVPRQSTTLAFSPLLNGAYFSVQGGF